MEIGVVGPIFTHKNIKGYVGQRYPYAIRWEINIAVIIHMYGARAIFYYFVITKTLKPSHVEKK